MFGLTALTTLSATAPLLLLRERRWRDGLAVTLAPLVLLLGFGLWRLGAVQETAATSTDTIVRLVQPGTNSLIRLPEAEQRQRVTDLVRLSFPEAAEGGVSAADVAIWSESSIQFFIDFYPEELAWLTEQLPEGAQVIAGGWAPRHPTAPTHHSPPTPPISSPTLAFRSATTKRIWSPLASFCRGSYRGSRSRRFRLARSGRAKA